MASVSCPAGDSADRASHWRLSATCLVAALVVAALTVACGGDRGRDSASVAGDADAALAAPVNGLDAPPAQIQALNQPFTGDLDAMRERRAIRAFVTYNHTQYFMDGPEQKGVSYELLQLFQKQINEKNKKGDVPVDVVILPVARERMLERLAEGYADLALGALTITPDREKIVAFSDPLAENVKEIVVTGPGGPAALATLDDLAGQEVWVRPGSSHLDSVRALSTRLEQQGKPAIKVKTADPNLESEDLLEMVNAGLYGTVVVDSYLADFWAQVFPQLHPWPGLVLRDDAKLAWALRKNTPQLMAEVNRFVAKNKKGTTTGNVLLKKYLGTTKYARNAYEEQDLERFRSMIGLFQKYADQYRFDWLLCAAQGYQESQLDQSKRSHVGAIGVMQVMPETARDKAVGIPNIEELEPNNHAGIKNLRWVIDTSFD
jgi:membrane-bound lytic murein transglycosylase MltF